MAEDDPHVVERLLIYVYTLEYPDWSDSPKDSKKNASGRSLVRSGKSIVPIARWETHLGLYKTADKICLRRLKAVAKKKLQSITHEEWGLDSFHLLLEQLWHMEQAGVEEVRAVALKMVSANTRNLTIRPQFRDLLPGGSTFNIDMVNQLIGGTPGPKVTSTETENQLDIARQKSKLNRKGLQEAVNSWVTGSQYSNMTNKRIVGRVLEIWDKCDSTEEH
jgi:hypothetical protein